MFITQTSADITNPLFSELVVKHVWARVCTRVCTCRQTHTCRVAKTTRKGPSHSRERAFRARPRGGRTHQPQVLHRLGEHALVQLQFADFHHLHTSDGVASWEEDPGRNQTANGVNGSVPRSQPFIRRPRGLEATLAGPANELWRGSK